LGYIIVINEGMSKILTLHVLWLISCMFSVNNTNK